MRKLFALLAMLAFIVSSAGVSEAAVKRIALTEFRNEVRTAEGERVCLNLYNDILTGIVQSKNYEVLERKALASIIRELGLQNSGMVNSSSAIEFGKLSGAELTVLGSVVMANAGPFKNGLYTVNRGKVRVALRIIDNRTGVIVISEVVDGSKSDITSKNFERLLVEASNEAARKILNYLNELNPLSGTIVSVKGNQIYVDLGSDDGIRSGMTLKVYREGNVIKHPVTGAIIGVEETDLGAIRIKEAKLNYAIGEIKSSNAAFKVGDKVKR